MKKSEKLLDAIGLVDDQLINEAAFAERKTFAEKKTKKKKKVTYLYRARGALAACAVLAICVGVFGLLNRNGLLFGPSGSGSSMAPAQEAAMEEAAVEEAALEEEVQFDTAVSAESVTVTSDAAAEEKAKASDISPEEAVKQAAEKEQQVRDAEDLDESTLDTSDKITGNAVGEATEQDGDEDLFAGEAPAAAESLQEDADGVRMEILAKDQSILTLSLSNQTGNLIEFDRQFLLEHWENGTWNVVTPASGYAWEEIALVLDHNESTIENIDLSAFGELAAGRYRIVKEYHLADDQAEQENLQTSVIQEMAVEFEIEK